MARTLSDWSEAHESAFPTGETPGPTYVEPLGIQRLGVRRNPLEGRSAILYARPMDNRIEGLCAEIRSVLLALRQRIAEEIGRHPRPITACDVHFNRLLEERAALSEELDRFDEYIAASAALTSEAKARIGVAPKNVVCP
jgi:hypothetical protein